MDFKAIFSMDLILGVLVAWLLDSLFAGMKVGYNGGIPGLPRVIPGTLDVMIPIPGGNPNFGIQTDNWITFGITFAGSLFLKGRYQNIMRIAFWTLVALKLRGLFVY